MSYVYRTAAPSPTALARIADAFEVNTTDLIDVPADVRLTDLKAYAGLELIELSQRVHLSVSYTSQVSRGEAPVTEPRLWAEALGVSETEILTAWTNSRRHLKES